MPALITPTVGSVEPQGAGVTADESIGTGPAGPVGCPGPLACACAPLASARSMAVRTIPCRAYGMSVFFRVSARGTCEVVPGSASRRYSLIAPAVSSHRVQAGFPFRAGAGRRSRNVSGTTPSPTSPSARATGQRCDRRLHFAEIVRHLQVVLLAPEQVA